MAPLWEPYRVSGRKKRHRMQGQVYPAISYIPEALPAWSCTPAFYYHPLNRILYISPQLWCTGEKGVYTESQCSCAIISVIGWLGVVWINTYFPNGSGVLWKVYFLVICLFVWRIRHTDFPSGWTSLHSY